MANVTTCTRCADLYQESSEERANEPGRVCMRCYHETTWPQVASREGEAPRADFGRPVPEALRSLHPVMQEALRPFWVAK